jgi:hypothetical protein
MQAEPNLEGAVSVDHRGQRYALGRTREAYAIWDLSRGGTAIEAHSLSEDGWQIAWHRYQEAWNQACVAYQRLERAGGG